MCKYDLYTSNNKRYVETECSKPKKDTNVWQSRIKIVHCGVRVNFVRHVPGGVLNIAGMIADTST